ncbi:MAG: carbon-nitrogen hydrolase family protein [Zoogloeaceae bacterium]|jgi:nitrilase|nr:carbon-nitrogen hydrolase family protein [Zoogloeaceae bacterium]
MSEKTPAPHARRNARIAAIQMISGTDVAANLERAAGLIAQAADAGAEILALPEYFPLIGASDARLREAGEAFGGGPIQDWLRETASRHGIWLLAGSIPLCSADPGRVLNSALVLDPAGEVRARYDKMHLFSFDNGREHYNEADNILPGHTPAACDTPFGRIGLSICYDLRFPELYRALGAPAPLDLIFLPAAFTDVTGRAHWEILLRARAIENQCYLLAAAQGGRHPTGRLTHGNSMIVDPWGEILARLDKGEGFLLAELDHRRIEHIRQQLPALGHRRTIPPISC